MPAPENDNEAWWHKYLIAQVFINECIEGVKFDILLEKLRID